MTWRQIASAPRDGTEFLAFGPQGYTVGFFRFDAHRKKRYFAVCYGTTWAGGSMFKATHWAPLPEPPTEDPIHE